MKNSACTFAQASLSVFGLDILHARSARHRAVHVPHAEHVAVAEQGSLGAAARLVVSLHAGKHADVSSLALLSSKAATAHGTTLLRGWQSARAFCAPALLNSATTIVSGTSWQVEASSSVT